MSSTMKPPTSKFQAGDRVAERPRATAIPNLRPDVLKRIQVYKEQRFGVVVDTYLKQIKAAKRGVVRRQFVRVLWDGLQTPSDHEQMRLVHERDFAQIQAEYIGSIGD
jgi:hypothetical protein